MSESATVTTGAETATETVASDATAPGGTAVPSSPSQITNATTSTEGTAAAPAAPAETVAADYVWEGNPENVPKPLQDRARGILRYLTKQSQALAEEKKLAEEYRRVKADPTFNQFMQSKQNGTSSPVAPTNQPMYTREELEEAQINPDKLGTLIDRVVDTRLKQAEQHVGGLLTELKDKQTFIDKKQELQDFAELHPDFWDLHSKGLMKPFLREIVDTGQGTLVDAYNQAKSVAAMFRQEALQESQARVQQKKAAFTAAPSASNEPEIVWANDKNEATRIAFENAVQGKKVQVRVKK